MTNKHKIYTNLTSSQDIDAGFLSGSVINRGAANAIITIGGSSFVLPTGVYYNFDFNGKYYEQCNINATGTIVEAIFTY
ncbi:MAG: hypothetical protein OHK0045_25410 [Raineya sp.]